MLLLKGLAEDGKSEEGGIGSLKLRRLDAESVSIKLQREWGRLEEGMLARHSAAGLLLRRLLVSLPGGSKGVDLLAETSLGELKAALDEDLLLKAGRKHGDTSRLLDRTLLWLHEQEVIRLNKGLSVFRSAMTLRLSPEKRKFQKPDFEPLSQHYSGQVEQIHVMAEYAQRGLAAVADAIRLALDYFSLDHGAFMAKWLPGREKDLQLQTTPESWRAIVESLAKGDQQSIVTDERKKANLLVLAGPGSGKTRVLVHRIAYLVRVKREKPGSTLALTYNRHAAVEIRKRLYEMIGDDARGVTVLTCDALAMRLTGASFAAREKAGDFDAELKAIRRQAVALLKGEGLPPEEQDEQRDRLLAGFDWILVDEYQDIGAEQYELIAALAGRSLQEEDSRLNLFAVGDDDQNIYAFNGASVDYIRRFEADYGARPAYLTQNYRSSAHIIKAANAMIAPAARRMKVEHPIRIDRQREKMAPGGPWQKRDIVAQGRVQILSAGPDSFSQAQAVMAEFTRMKDLAPDWDWSNCAVIAREWKTLEPLRAWCELHGVPAQMADEPIPVWALRETQALVAWLRERPLVDGAALGAWLVEQVAWVGTRSDKGCREAPGADFVGTSSDPQNIWWDLLAEAVAEYGLETGAVELPSRHCSEWLAEWGREAKRRQRGLLLLTAHRAKGLEFAHVAVLDGGWGAAGRNEDQDAPRRLYYVAMTRARQSLCLARFDGGARHALLDGLPVSAALLHRPAGPLPAADPALARCYRVLSQKDVDIGFAGRSPAAAAVHRHIAKLQPGDALQLRRRQEGWELADSLGRAVGHLAKAWQAPSGMDCIETRVWAILRRTKAPTAEEYLAQVQSDSWEVVLPELVFQASGSL